MCYADAVEHASKSLDVLSGQLHDAPANGHFIKNALEDLFHPVVLGFNALGKFCESLLMALVVIWGQKVCLHI